ncbi:MAG: aspartate aminotransferase [Subtercola sp.]|nr:aspartate aminotransferase [Subtercola sp.]
MGHTWSMDLLRADPLPELRTRTSMKWRAYPDDVLPLFVAEMDYPLAEPVKAALIDLIERSDLGYISGCEELARPFAAFAAARWGWMLDPSGVRTTTDVSVAAVESLRQAIAPGDRVVITPPVYQPFFEYVTEAGGVVVEVPLLEVWRDAVGDAVGDAAGNSVGDAGGDSVRTTDRWALDLDGLERAFAAGATAFLLCNPHNPLGLVHPRETLERVAALALKYGAIIVSDEIHGPLVHDPSTFTPFLNVSPAAREVGITLTSASKGWNLAGAKCALMVAQAERTLALLDAMPDEVFMRTSQLGLHASIAAFADGVPWLDAMLATLTASSDLLAELLAEQLPQVVFARPQASYLAWLDFSGLGWGPDPSFRALEAARVALSPGLGFGREGAGYARLNFACSPEVLTQAVSRLAQAAALVSAAEAAAVQLPAAAQSPAPAETEVSR